MLKFQTPRLLVVQFVVNVKKRLKTHTRRLSQGDGKIFEEEN